MKNNCYFYALKVNGQVVSIFSVLTETLVDLIKWMHDDEATSFEIMRSKSVLGLISKVEAGDNNGQKDVLDITSYLAAAIKQEQQLEA